MSEDRPVILWFRADLRLRDNVALTAATEAGAPLLPIFILDDETPGDRRLGAAARWWLDRSLALLAESLAARGAVLRFFKGRADEVMRRLVERTEAKAVFWNRLYTKPEIDRDAAIKKSLKETGVAATSFNGGLIAEPWTVTTKTGDPYKVFTPFWRNLRAAAEPPRPLDAPERLDGWGGEAGGVTRAELDLAPKKDWADGFTPFWTPGEAGAAGRLRHFLDAGLARYDDARNFPGMDGTSRLSAHLRFGEIAPWRVWRAAASRLGEGAARDAQIESFLSELGWREFSYHLLHHFPHITDRNFKSQFDRFPWRKDDDALEAWRRGRTGYPIVDAGMRQLWARGWMHNRVRMIVGSFLVKHLLIDWREGERWFWDTLVDADPASNAAGWQWVAGSGADASPYFRIFNPMTQAMKFDDSGSYVREWIPEIAALDDKTIHAPWTAAEEDLRRAGVRLGETYPQPIVDHNEARRRALTAYDEVKGE